LKVHGVGLSGDCRNLPKCAGHFIDNDANGSNCRLLLTLINLADVAQAMAAAATINDFMMDFPSPMLLNAFHHVPKR
jgi:hypothetical protein